MSIADALQEVKIKIDKAYQVLEESGATIPEEKNLDNLPAAIESKPGSSSATTWVYYNGSDIEAGKKILLTRTNNAMATDEGFVNGKLPLLIHDGIAYCGGTTNGTINEMFNIIDGKIDESLGKMITNLPSTTGTPNLSYPDTAYKKYTHIQSVCNNAVMLQTAISSIAGTNTSYYNGSGCSLIKGNLYSEAWGSSSGSNYMLYYNALFMLENSLIWMNKNGAGTNYGYNGTLLVDLSDESIYGKSTNVLSKDRRITVGTSYGHSLAFERKDDLGCVYFIYNSYNGTPIVPALAKYTFSTNTLETSVDDGLEVPYFDLSLISGNKQVCSKGVYHQTKDYKYLLYNDYYVHLYESYKTDGISGEDGIVVKEYPEVIKATLGERTIVSIQTFYDYSFALTLSDGSTLMCKYNESSTSDDNDWLQHTCSVEEIAPYTLPDDDTIFYRHFSGNKMYWFLSAFNMSNGDKLTASPYKADESISSYLGVKNTVGRYNSTVLTAFMTGETKKDDNGLTMIEVETVLPK